MFYSTGRVRHIKRLCEPCVISAMNYSNTLWSAQLEADLSRLQWKQKQKGNGFPVYNKHERLALLTKISKYWKLKLWSVCVWADVALSRQRVLLSANDAFNNMYLLVLGDSGNALPNNTRIPHLNIIQSSSLSLSFILKCESTWIVLISLLFVTDRRKSPGDSKMFAWFSNSKHEIWREFQCIVN